LEFRRVLFRSCGPGARILWQQVLPAPMVPALCSFAAQQNVAIVTYSPEGIVTERPQDPWAMREGFTNKLPMVGVPDLPAYVNYPVNKMLITLDPIRLRSEEHTSELQSRFDL